jgi:hypothetical protein
MALRAHLDELLDKGIAFLCYVYEELRDWSSGLLRYLLGDVGFAALFAGGDGFASICSCVHSLMVCPDAYGALLVSISL